MRTTKSQHGERCLWRRSWSVGIATALLAAAPFVASAESNGTTGGENSSATYKGVGELPGHTFEELKAGTTSDCSYKDANKVYFLYNVGTGKLLNMGGYWGTHASLKDYPMPLWTREGTPLENSSVTTPSINFTQNIATTDGNLMKWVKGGTNPTTDTGVFFDRPKDGNINNGYDGWFFEEVEGDEKNTYRIYTYSSPSGGSESDRLYLFGYPQGLGTADKNCGADTKKNLSQDFPNDDFYKWRVLTLQDFYTLQEENSENLDGPLDLSYKLKCPGFERGRKDISDWHVFTSSVAPGSYTRIGLQELNWKMDTEVSTKSVSLTRGSGNSGEGYNNGNFYTSSSYSYSFPYSGTTPQTINGKDNYRRFMGKFFCMDVHGTRGYIYQKVFVKHPGTYVIECKGYSNTDKAHLFAGVAGQDGQGMGIFDGSRRTTMLSQVSNMTEAEKERLHVAEQNMDYAGKEFYESNKYINSVIVQVTDQMITDAKNAGQEGACIAFGLYIGNPNANEAPSADEWTVFDDFRVLYASNVKSEDLVLDELRGDLNYLKDGITYKNRTLRLAKTFTKDRWNSFVLPVNLTVSQVRAAFGANVRLAKLNNLTATELLFETVNLDENEKATAIVAYQPYIIFPTKTMAEYDGSPYTAKITTTGSGENYKVMIQGQHFEIPNVTFNMTADNKNDLSKMDAKWTTKMTHNVGAITAYGTFVRTFGKEATQDETTGVWTISNKGTIREDYDNLIGSYFFDQGNVYFSDTRERGLRGFSCWFKPNPNNEATPEVYIDGVKQEAALTAIGELIIGPEAANRYGKNNGVYNLQGQRVGNTTEGLPSGIYIVNGRKHVVR